MVTVRLKKTQAYRLGMTHANGYLWLFHAWYPSEWWLDEPADRTGYKPVICERKEIEEMIEYSILISHYANVGEDQRNDPTNATLVRQY